MDPLSITASTIAAVDVVRKILRRIGTFSDVLNTQDVVRKLETGAKLLELIGQEGLVYPIPSGSECEELFSAVEGKKAFAQSLKRELQPGRLRKVAADVDAFLLAVQLLQSSTQGLRITKIMSNLQTMMERQSCLLDVEAKTSEQIICHQQRHTSMVTDILAHLADLKLRGADFTSVNQLHENFLKMKETTEREATEGKMALDELKQKLREQTHLRQHALQDSEDHVFDIQIFDSAEPLSEKLRTKALLDSACNDNWISLPIVQEAGQHINILQNETPAEYVTFSGDTITPEGFVKMIWCMKKAENAVIHETTFMVHSKLPFNVILGMEFFKENYTLVRKQALGLVRQSTITKGERITIAKRLAEQGSSSQDIRDLQRDKEAQERKNKRALKASLAASRGTTTPFSRLSGSTTPVDWSPAQVPRDTASRSLFAPFASQHTLPLAAVSRSEPTKPHQPVVETEAGSLAKEYGNKSGERGLEGK